MRERSRLLHLLLTACLCTVSVALVFWAGSVSLAAGQQAPTFRFNPPDGTTCLETITGTQTLDFGEGRAITRETELRQQMAVKRTPKGYEITNECVSVRTQNSSGKRDDLQERLMDLFRGAPLTYEVDQGGGLVNVAGLDVIAQRAKALFPPEVLAMAGKRLDKEALLARERADWNDSATKLIGRRAAVGEAWVEVEEWLAPCDEVVKYYVANKIVGQARVGRRECVQVRMQFNTDLQKLREFLGDQAGTALSQIAPLGPGPSVEGGGQATVDPQTLLWYAASSRREVKAHVTVPGQGTIPVTIRETKRSQYNYEKEK
jgi:hypothetical protein